MGHSRVRLTSRGPEEVAPRGGAWRRGVPFCGGQRGRARLVDGQLRPVCLARGMLSADGTLSERLRVQGPPCALRCGGVFIVYTQEAEAGASRRQGRTGAPVCHSDPFPPLDHTRFPLPFRPCQCPRFPVRLL